MAWSRSKWSHFHSLFSTGPIKNVLHNVGENFDKSSTCGVQNLLNNLTIEFAFCYLKLSNLDAKVKNTQCFDENICHLRNLYHYKLAALRGKRGIGESNIDSSTCHGQFLRPVSGHLTASSSPHILLPQLSKIPKYVVLLIGILKLINLVKNLFTKLLNGVIIWPNKPTAKSFHSSHNSFKKYAGSCFAFPPHISSNDPNAWYFNLVQRLGKREPQRNKETAKFLISLSNYTCFFSSQPLKSAHI
ncbi:hypothetical protein EGR_04937 [Echinococcus granulosus]|uniref:Uncharacterized protein n=1 Tax=Echinococcus granulosus TaxID=6210 RepID=W6UPM5_ECHGR|nr:hypothetical protein EGR_04937 [Echinococcus granulosus]EUB60227.1 hypothetical protein EGR_04937 [Echinococcus granulosus]